MHVGTKSEQPIKHPGSRVADAESSVCYMKSCWSTFSDQQRMFEFFIFFPASFLRGATQISFDLNELSHTRCDTWRQEVQHVAAQNHMFWKKDVVPVRGGEETLIHVEKEEYKYED